MTARIFTRGVIVIGALWAGFLAQRFGVRVALVGGGAAQVAAAALMWRALGRGDLERG